jgi:hypothetical protein
MYITDLLIYRSFSLLYIKFDDKNIYYELPFPVLTTNIISNYDFSIKDNIVHIHIKEEHESPYLIIKIPEIQWKSKYILMKNIHMSKIESIAYIKNKLKSTTLYFDSISLIFRKQDYDNKHYPSDLDKINHHHIHTKHKDLPNLDCHDIVKFKTDLKKIDDIITYSLWKHVIDIKFYYELFILLKAKHLHQIIEFISPETILPGELEIYDQTNDSLDSIGSFDTSFFNKDQKINICFPKSNDLHVFYNIDDHVHLFKSRVDVHVQLKIKNKFNVKGDIKIMYPSKKAITSIPEYKIEDKWLFWIVPCQKDKFEINLSITESS